MKSYTRHLWLNTAKRQEFINITPSVEDALKKIAFGDNFLSACRESADFQWLVDIYILSYTIKKVELKKGCV